MRSDRLFNQRRSYEQPRHIVLEQLSRSRGERRLIQKIEKDLLAVMTCLRSKATQTTDQALNLRPDQHLLLHLLLTLRQTTALPQAELHQAAILAYAEFLSHRSPISRIPCGFKTIKEHCQSLRHLPKATTTIPAKELTPETRWIRNEVDRQLIELNDMIVQVHEWRSPGFLVDGLKLSLMVLSSLVAFSALAAMFLVSGGIAGIVALSISRQLVLGLGASAGLLEAAKSVATVARYWNEKSSTTDYSDLFGKELGELAEWIAFADFISGHRKLIAAGLFKTSKTFRLSKIHRHQKSFKAWNRSFEESHRRLRRYYGRSRVKLIRRLLRGQKGLEFAGEVGDFIQLCETLHTGNGSLLHHLKLILLMHKFDNRRLELLGKKPNTFLELNFEALSLILDLHSATQRINKKS